MYNTAVSNTSHHKHMYTNIVLALVDQSIFLYISSSMEVNGLEDTANVVSGTQFHTLEEIAAFLHTDRDQANARLKDLLQNNTKTVVEESLCQRLEGEMFHVHFVQETFGKITGQKSSHDWSKDLVYMAILGIAYSLNRADLVRDLMEQEVERHYRLEDHHPEHTDYSGVLMTDRQILEMAVDRLSRNLQFNEGKLDLELLLKYEPKMRKCPVCGQAPPGGKCEHEEEMLRTYWKYIQQHNDFIGEQWNAMVEGKTVYQKVLTAK